MRIRNICRINYEHPASDGNPPIHEIVYSNQAQTTLIDKRIKAIKTVDKHQVAFFEQLTYTIEISNISNHDIPFCFFQDYLTTNVIFKNGSVKVDGVTLYLENPQCGFYLYNLCAYEKKVITFIVIVNYCSKKSTILNTATIEYPHQYNTEANPLHWIEESNTTMTNIISKQIAYWNLKQFKLGPSALYYELFEMETCIESQKIHISPCEQSKLKVVVTAKIKCELGYKYRHKTNKSVQSYLKHKFKFYITRCFIVDTKEHSSFMINEYKLYFCKALACQTGICGTQIHYKFLLALNYLKEK